MVTRLSRLFEAYCVAQTKTKYSKRRSAAITLLDLRVSNEGKDFI